MYIINYRKEQIGRKLELAKNNVNKIEEFENEYELKIKSINLKIEAIKVESMKDIGAEFDKKIQQATQELDAKFFSAKIELHEQFDNLDVTSAAKQLLEKFLDKIANKNIQA